MQEGVVVHAHTFKIRATWAGHQISTCVDTCTTLTKTKTEQTTSHVRSSRSTTGIAKGSAALVPSNANVAAPTGSLHNTIARHNPPSHITGYAKGDDNQRWLQTAYVIAGAREVPLKVDAPGPRYTVTAKSP